MEPISVNVKLFYCYYGDHSFFCFVLQYRTETNGIVETRMEKKVVITEDGDDDIDHDAVSPTELSPFTHNSIPQHIQDGGSRCKGQT